MTAPTLIVIDVQRAFGDAGWGPRNNPHAEARIAQAIGGWRAAGAPIIHVRHASTEPDGLFARGSRSFEFKPAALPDEGEPVITKTVNSAFIATDLEAHLRDREVQTGDMIRAEVMHRAALASLNNEFAAVLDTTVALARATGAR